MNKRNTTLLLSLLAVAGALSISASAEAAGRVRGRAVVHGTEGGRVVATAAAGRGTYGAYARGRQAASDGQGNVQGQRRAAAAGVRGGEFASQGSFYRQADGSAGRQGSTSLQTARGGQLATSGAVARAADGTIAGSRATSATGANGNSYQGSTSYSNGQLTHSASCSNAAGEAIACPRAR